MKKIAIILAFFMMVTFFTGCQDNVVKRYEPMTPVYDINENEIFGIEMQSKIISFLDDGFVFCSLGDKDSYNIWYVDYYRYYINSKKTVKLGTLAQYAGQSPCAALLSDHLYVLAITGEKGKNMNSLNLLDIDLKKNKMKLISDGAIAGNVQMDNGAYCSSAITIDRSDEKHPRLLILKQSVDPDAKHPNSVIVQYDPKTHKSSDTRFSDILKASQNNGISTRAISASGDKLLILQDSSTNNSAGIISCSLKPSGKDQSGNYIYNDININADDISSLLGTSSNEFYVFSDYVFYMNVWNHESFFGVMKDGNLEKVDTGCNFRMAADAAQSDTEAVFIYENDIYYFNLNAADGEIMKKTTFTLPSGFSGIGDPIKTADGRILIGTLNIDLAGDNTKDYFIKLSDLNFENVKLLDS